MESLFIPERHIHHRYLKRSEAALRTNFKAPVSGQCHAAPPSADAILGTVGTLEQASRTGKSSARAAHGARNLSGPCSPANSPFFDLSGGIQ